MSPYRYLPSTLNLGDECAPHRVRYDVDGDGCPDVIQIRPVGTSMPEWAWWDLWTAGGLVKGDVERVEDAVAQHEAWHGRRTAFERAFDAAKDRS